jgi:hypothetical protein
MEEMRDQHLREIVDHDPLAALEKDLMVVRSSLSEEEDSERKKGREREQ